MDQGETRTKMKEEGIIQIPKHAFKQRRGENHGINF